MSDIKELVNTILQFNADRGWRPKSSDAAKSVVIEASELLEHFQWDESYQKNEPDIDAIQEEVADVFWYLVTFCESAQIDIETAVRKKIEKNSRKYPKELFGGVHDSKLYMELKKKSRGEK